MARKRSASRNVPWTRSVKRDKIGGGLREGRRSASSTSFARLLGRLRRLEFAMLYVMGERLKFDVDSFKDAVLSLEADAQIESRGGDVRGSEVQVPHEGRVIRKAARAAKNIRRSASRNESEASPFPPGPPDEEA